MIVVTGSSGFIGGAVIRKLIEEGKTVQCFDYLPGKDIGCKTLHPSLFRAWWQTTYPYVEAVIHLGAITDTTCTDKEVIQRDNVEFSKLVFSLCTEDAKPLVYASSAAVYGDGAKGFREDAADLVPLNLYAQSKYDFDKHVLKLRQTPPNWYGLRFFNVFGFDESRKKHMASMVYKGWQQAKAEGSVTLFSGSYEYCRDFVYVEDVVSIILWLLEVQPKNGIYNVGTGKAQNFHQIVDGLRVAMKKRILVHAIPMPKKLEAQYQKYTCADITKLRAAGYKKNFTSIPHGCKKTIKQYENSSVSVQS